MGRFWALLVSFVLFISIGYAAHANLSEFEEAEKQFTANTYASAKEIYEKNLNPRNPANLYNLSLAELKLNNFGVAYYHLLLAKKISPWDQDITNNLKYISSQLAGAAQGIRPSGMLLEFLPSFLHIHYSVFFTLALLCLSSFLLIAIGAWDNSAASTVFLSLFLFFSTLTGMSFHDEKQLTAVVINSKTILRSGPATSFSEITELTEGTLARVDEEKKGWLKLSFKTPQNSEMVGWSESSALAVIK